MPSRIIQYVLKKPPPPWCTTMTRGEDDADGGGDGASVGRGGSATLTYLQYGQADEVPGAGGWTTAPQWRQLEDRGDTELVIDEETPAEGGE